MDAQVGANGAQMPGARGSLVRGALWLAVAVAPIALTLALVRPVAQDPAYHGFADGRTLLGIPNALNVLSNAAFLVVGTLGIRLVTRGRGSGGAPIALDAPSERAAWLGFFAGVGLTALGSAWYHWAPDGERLVWDRLPMTIGFLSLLAVVVGERVSARAAGWLLLPLLVVGLASVGWWRLTEARGAGDLRPYGLVQFYPALAIPVLVACFPARYTRGADYLTALGWYVAAKVAEAGDARLLALTHGFVSGHTVKHLLAAVATAWLLRMLSRRARA